MTLSKESKKALLLAVVYVGIATVFLYSTYPTDIFAFNGKLYDNPVYMILSLVFLPGNLLGNTVRFAESDLHSLVLILQIITGLFWWGLIYLIVRKK